MQVRTRFAPSPTGYMHIGNLRSGLYAYLFARKHGGRFLLRIEDTDQDRFVEGATELIYRTLKDVGMDWDEGPDIGGDYGPYVQSERKVMYLPYAEQLIAAGHAYRCFCTKEELEERRAAAAARGETFKYDKHCLRLSQAEIQAKLDAGLPYVVRQNVPTEGTTSFTDMIFGTITVNNVDLDDNVLIKADGMPTYNFANVVDDHLMAISHDDARYGVPFEHAQIQPALRGLRLGDPPLYPHDPHHARRPAQALQAGWRRLLCRFHR